MSTQNKVITMVQAKENKESDNKGTLSLLRWKDRYNSKGKKVLQNPIKPKNSRRGNEGEREREYLISGISARGHKIPTREAKAKPRQVLSR